MTELTQRQKNLLMWRDYLDLLQQGLDSRGKGSSDNPWSQEEIELTVWLDVMKTELESDAMHLETNQPQYCRFDRPTDLSAISANIEL